MRNINILECKQFKINEQISLEWVYVNEHNQKIYLISKDKYLVVIVMEENNKYSVINEWDLSREIEINDMIVDASYIMEQEGLIVIMKSGEIYKVEVESGSVENVGSIEGGIMNGKWSNNQEMVVIGTKNRTLVMLDSNIDLKGEVKIDDEDMSTNDEVDVEADFQIDWRGDSKYFIINYGFINGQGRKCLVRDCNLVVFKSQSRSDKVVNNKLIQNMSLVQSVSEKPLLISFPVAWQPSGGLILGVQKQGDDNFCIIWEKNGLRHGEFKIEEIDREKGGVDVQQIEWCNNSEMVIILLRNEQGKQRVCLYVRSNYKWYMKCYLEGRKNETILRVEMGELNRGRLMIFYKEGVIEYLELDYDHDGDRIDAVHYYLNVDNSQAHLTHFHQAVIPPPLSTFSLQSYSILIAKLFHSHFLLIDSHFITLYHHQNIQTQIPNTFFAPHQRIRHLLLINHYIICIQNINFQPHLCQLNLSTKLYHQTPLTYQVLSTFYSSSYYQLKEGYQQIDHIYFQNQQQEICRYNLQDQSIFPIVKYQSKFKKALCYLDQKKQSEIFIGLSINNKLFMNNKLLTNDCTSFSLNQNFLFFTTLSTGMYHQLFTFNLNEEQVHNINGNLHQIISQLQVQHEQIHKVQCLNVRNVEKGSRIIGLVGQKLVMQICPRGNLETIYPRLVMLQHIKNLIDEKDYFEAFTLLRTHKLDMNLLFDLNPSFFIENTGFVVENLKKHDYIALFLQNVNNLQSPWIHQILDSQKIQDLNNYLITESNNDPYWKVNTICDKIRAILIQSQNDKYLLIMIHTYVKKIPQELEAALVFVQDIKEKEKKMEKENGESGPERKKEKGISGEQALEYLCWLADANKMFEVALSSYDLELVEMVGLQTQKDPREYMPYLEELQNIKDEVERKSKICMDQSNFKQAIVELSKGNPQQIQRAFQITQQHHLYHLAINVFSSHPPLLTQIHSLFGIYLLDRKLFSQAILHFIKAKDYPNLLTTYKLDFQWQNALQLAQNKLNYDSHQINNLKLELIELLKNNNFNSEAAKLCLLNQDPKQSLELFLKAADFQSLVEYLNSVQNLEEAKIIEEKIIKQLELNVNLKMNELKSNLQDFNIKYQRLLIVQEIKKNMPVDLGEKLQNENDTMSEMSQLSQGSFTSIKTAGGGRRKQRKDKALTKRNIKQGSVYEEEYLVQTLTILKLSHSDFEFIQNIVQFLIYFNLNQLASKLWEFTEQYVRQTNKVLKMQCQIQFEQQNPNLSEIYPHINQFNNEKLIKQQSEIQSMFIKFDHLKL